MSVSPRLLDDPSTSEKLQGDLRCAQLHAVAPYDTAAGLARFRAGINHGATLDGAGRGTIPPAAGGALRASPWKLFAALGVAGVVTWVLLSGTSSKPTPSSKGGPGASAPLGETIPESAQTSGRSTSKLMSEGEVAVPQIRPEVESPLEEVTATSVRASVKVTKELTPRAEKSDPFAEEIADLAKLRQLHRTDPGAAVVLAKDGHRMFPQGMLYEEREALLILSLDKLGQSAEAERRAAAFRERFPTSAFLSKMQRLSPVAEESPGANP